LRRARLARAGVDVLVKLIINMKNLKKFLAFLMNTPFLYEGTPILVNLLNLIDILSVIVPILLSVAFMTIIERKLLGAMQRRLGPTDVGYFGVLQPFSDALKLILKESVVPAQSNKILFYLAPVVTLVFSLLGWAIVPFGQGLVISD
jgi:NADH-ubiquinone oxidoreductase chain 1